MKKKVLLFVFVLQLASMAGRAQMDSTQKIDIGWLTLNKDFTQTVAIKGVDLEKMPFVNLSDAIAAWLYGAYTVPGNLAYVVDGNPVTDVNVYPIFDIEEVTLVEHAAGGAAYGGTQQELVVITTKRDKGRGGIRADVQTGLVKANGNGRSTVTNIYHQYYLGAYRNFNKLSVGVSADWIRDVVPATSGADVQVSTPDNLQRWRLNGYLTWTPVKGNIIELRVSYAPQVAKEALDSVQNYNLYQVNFHNNSHLLAPQLSWHADLSAGLKNDLYAEYLGASENSSFLGYDSSFTYPPNIVHYGELSAGKISQLLVRDRLSYELAAGAWHFAPALNFLYDHIDEKTAYATSTFAVSGYSGPPVIIPPMLGSLQEQKGNLLFLTPGADIRWGKAVDLQVGAQMNVGSKVDSGAKRVFPFAGLCLDLSRLSGETDGENVKLFGSYAQRSQTFVDDYSLFDFSGGGGVYSLANVYHQRYEDELISTFSSSGGVTDTVSYLEQIPIRRPAVYWTWEAGILYTTANGRVKLQYTFERRNFSTGGMIDYLSLTTSGSYSTIPDWKSDLHHFDIRWKAVDSKEGRWETGLNLTLLKSKQYTPGPDSFYLTTAVFYSVENPPVGDLPPNPLSWTGGWVNRWQAGDFTAGLDLLYHFGESERVYGPYGGLVNGPKLNSVLLPNVYIGNRWKLRHGETLELFLESRGLIRSQHSDLLDTRRYYTIGGKLAL
ncbi:MAG TPA: hypothetical protein VG052_05605 [Puia sp.]|jgi:hypothetical protein|nr:hypothetical protein [Puia sp.]